MKHTIFSRIVNKIKLKAKGKESLSVQLYELLLSATNCRIILLTLSLLLIILMKLVFF